MSKEPGNDGAAEIERSLKHGGIEIINSRAYDDYSTPEPLDPNERVFREQFQNGHVKPAEGQPRTRPVQ